MITTERQTSFHVPACINCLENGHVMQATFLAARVDGTFALVCPIHLDGWHYDPDGTPLPMVWRLVPLTIAEYTALHVIETGR